MPLVPDNFIYVPGPKGWQFHDELLNHPFAETHPNSLIRAVFQARSAANAEGASHDLAHGWQERVWDGVCRQHPEIPCHDEAEGPLPELVKIGRALWKELHEYAQNYFDEPTPTQMASAERWFMEWRKKVPSFGCACKEHLAEALRTVTMDYSSRTALYSSTVALHNAINRILGKAQWVPPLEGAPKE